MSENGNKALTASLRTITYFKGFIKSQFSVCILHKQTDVVHGCYNGGPQKPLVLLSHLECKFQSFLPGPIREVLYYNCGSIAIQIVGRMR